MYRILFLWLFISLVSCGPGELIDEHKSKSYFINSSGDIIYCTNGNYLAFGTETVDADKASFKVIEDAFARDKNYIFYKGLKQPQIDYHSFYLEKGIPKDKQSVYLMDFNRLKKIENVDAQTFEYLSIDTLNNCLSRDKFNYFLNLKKLKVDRKTFTFLNDTFAKDKDSVYAYFNCWKLQSLLPNNQKIEVLNERYIKTKNQLYYVSDFEKAELLSINYTNFKYIRVVDKNIICVNDDVVYDGKKFKDKTADAKSFVVYFPGTMSFYTKDKNSVYYDQVKIPGADPKTYKPLVLGFGKDDKNVYYETKLLQGVDAHSFKETGEYSTIFGDKYGHLFNSEGKKL
ncbi:DKNYY domain-containing protein [Flavobacterium sp. CYK-55]|uniref:DKNYY domain-containing protein n=1 Tax=Flavobacterium sp. CYK-55 TaxID=2835529 RepID=UPI001BD09F30|nr:DKNYY domain-containing protein [Flavobacterium sp. CYK-55]MBS7786186.1 DKNYY domain-containing protein [Flavobacterium sp. CYK-55]